jgi:hypothetical protein
LHRPLASRTAGPIGNARQRNLRKVNEKKKAFNLKVIAFFQAAIPRSGGRSTLARNGLRRYGLDRVNFP